MAAIEDVEVVHILESTHPLIKPHQVEWRGHDHIDRRFIPPQVTVDLGQPF